MRRARLVFASVTGCYFGLRFMRWSGWYVRFAIALAVWQRALMWLESLECSMSFSSVGGCRKSLPRTDTSPSKSGATLTFATIGLSVLVGVAGIAKLAGAKPLADQFQEFGLPKSMMLVVGSLEVAAAIGLSVRTLTFYAASGLAVLMLGAIGNHVKVKHPFSQMVPSVLVLGLAAMVAVASWPTAGLIWEFLGF